MAERLWAGDKEKELRRKEKAKRSEPDMKMSGDGRLARASNSRGNTWLRSENSEPNSYSVTGI